MKIIDISPLINSQTAVFPGDTAFSRQISMSWEKGHHLELSSFQSTCHIGAHADAVNHYDPDGEGIDKKPLEPYIGPAQVIHLPDLGKAERILPSHIENIDITAPRVLFRTDSFLDPQTWTDDFNSLSAPLIDYLAISKVKLVGIDTPSVDPADSKDLPSHKTISKHNISILEGLIMKDVEAGQYWLSALPLKLQEMDASPVRAVLIKGPIQFPGY